MKFNIITCSLEKQKVSCIITAIFNNNELSQLTKNLDKISNNYISKTLKNSYNDKNIEYLILNNVPKINSDKIVLINCGNKNNLSKIEYKKIINCSMQIIENTHSESALFLINNDCNIKNQNIFYNTKNLIININNFFNNKELYKTTKKKYKLKNIIIYSTKNELNNTQKSIKYGIIISKSIRYTQILANTPSNFYTQSFLINEAYNLSKIYKNLSVKIIDRKKIKKLQMNSILSISTKKKNIIIMKYKNEQNKKPLILVTKKNINYNNEIIKNDNYTDEIKYNLCGASIIYGIFLFILELKIKINVIGIISTTNIKNMISNTIIKSMSGKTIKTLNINNSDFLILCDLLTYSKKYNPNIIISISTNIKSFINVNYTNLHSNNSKLANDLLIAGKITNALCWKMPLSKKYNEIFRNSNADITITKNNKTNTCTYMAHFLSNFTKNIPWAHLNIQNLTQITTNKPIKLLIQYIVNLSLNIK